MLEFIKEYWTEILSIVGAAAWLPIIFKPIITYIINHLRKLQATVLDYRILTNSYSVAVGRKKIINGTILLLATNLYINKITVFARKASLKLKLNNGSTLNSEFLDFSTITSNNDDGTESIFNVSAQEEFNVSRTIHPNVDNIKYIAVLVEKADFSNLDEIAEIELRLYYSGIKCNWLSKKVIIKQSDFPTFNSSHMLDTVERTRMKKVKNNEI